MKVVRRANQLTIELDERSLQQAGMKPDAELKVAVLEGHGLLITSVDVDDEKVFEPAHREVLKRHGAP